jgi:transposase
MAWRGLTTPPGEAIRAPLPPPQAATRGGRPRVDARRCGAGILGPLWTGAQGRALPRRYGSARTCWRRRQEWEAPGGLLKRWRAFVAPRPAQQQRRWDACCAAGRFAPATTGAPRSARRNAARVRSGWLWSMARVRRGEPTWRRPPRRRAGASQRPSTPWPSGRARRCQPPAAGPLGASGPRAEPPSPRHPHAGAPARRTAAAAIPAAVEGGASLRLARACSPPGRAR